MVLACSTLALLHNAILTVSEPCRLVFLSKSHDLQGCVKKLPKPGAPSDRPLVVLLRFFSRAVAALKRQKSATSDGAPSPSSMPAPGAAADGFADS
jgi:hypothetical protein